jgi:hypothetical protein
MCFSGWRRTRTISNQRTGRIAARKPVELVAGEEVRASAATPAGGLKAPIENGLADGAGVLKP